MWVWCGPLAHDNVDILQGQMAFIIGGIGVIHRCSANAWDDDWQIAICYRSLMYLFTNIVLGRPLPGRRQIYLSDVESVR